MPVRYPPHSQWVQARSLSYYLTATFWSIRRILTLRRVLLLATASTVLSILFVLRSGIPPTLMEIRDYENNLPQHNLTEALYDKSLDPPGRRKYLRVEGGAHGVGFNNVLQQLLHLTYLAHESGRAFVFEDYTWSQLPFRYTLYDYALRPTRLPINAITSGASAGGAVPLDSLRSVSVGFFNQVCREENRVVIDASEAPPESDFNSGTQLVRWWLDRLKKVGHRPCVVIRATKQFTIFDWSYIGSPLPLSFFPLLNSSAAVTHFSWSPLVLSAVARNFALLKPSDPQSLFVGGTEASVLKGLVALHLRRGDFKSHCHFVHEHHAQYSGFNKLEVLLDKFNSAANPSFDYYRQHCYPDIDEILEKLNQVRKDNPSLGLKRVFLLSNGSGWWVYRLAQKLKENGWTDVVGSNDLRLDSGQKQVSGAVDMAIAEKAEVFIGNGFEWEYYFATSREGDEAGE
ncbi:hypothetical protein V5O48_014571 [Marasmius crinis-equi]|uniref:Uncharacterized protein n=1 Tax=Marasmius crinis-equi TaxID=585013 RepID=A0ABR3EWZ6_9AGAR